MNLEEKKEKLLFLQHFFVKSFVISFVFLIMATAMCMIYHNAQYDVVKQLFPISMENFNYMVVLTLGLWKVLIFQFTLVPALAIWWARSCCCKCDK